jgi:hypothetical protein
VAASADPAPAADPDAPTVGMSLDRTVALVGDRLSLTVSAVAKAGVLITLPGKLDLGKLEVIDRDDGERGGRDLGDGRRAHRFVLGVAAYETGELELPSVELSYLNPRGEVRTVRTDPLTVTIRSLVGSAPQLPPAQPIRPPRSAMVEDRRVVIGLEGVAAAFGALVVGVGLSRLVRRAVRRVAPVAEVGSVPGRAPDAVAMERLEAVRRAGNFGLDHYRPFYFAVAEVVRAYLGARYGFDSLELTTTELIGRLQWKAPHLCEPGSQLLQFLADTDLVKFAQTGSNDADARRALDTAQAIVLSTTKALEEAAALAGPVRPPMESSGG